MIRKHAEAYLISSSPLSLDVDDVVVVAAAIISPFRAFPGEAPALPVQPRRIPLRSTDRDCHIITFIFFPTYHLPNLHSTKSHKSHSPPFSRAPHFCLPPPPLPSTKTLRNNRMTLSRVTTTLRMRFTFQPRVRSGLGRIIVP